MPPPKRATRADTVPVASPNCGPVSRLIDVIPLALSALNTWKFASKYRPWPNANLLAALIATIWTAGAECSPYSPIRSVTEPCLSTADEAVNCCVRCSRSPDCARYDDDSEMSIGKLSVPMAHASQFHVLSFGN